MSVVNGTALLALAPIAEMLDHKAAAHGVSYGLTEAGYDIRVKQKIHFTPDRPVLGGGMARAAVYVDDMAAGMRFTLASSAERFQMPTNLVGYVKDKSTWARRGLSVFNTGVKPGWRGNLTLELVYHGNVELVIPAGAGIAQVLFHRLEEAAQYEGKYQGQEDAPIPARES